MIPEFAPTGQGVDANEGQEEEPDKYLMRTNEGFHQFDRVLMDIF